uniref:Uncharacterized protein n=1 Tax=Sphaerodactylus townsendi TaxID=933632 RepID=A0ACB8E8T5_9SAUR
MCSGRSDILISGCVFAFCEKADQTWLSFDIRIAEGKGLQAGSEAKFTEDCKFRERFQENSYNTYASAVYRTEKTGREWFRQVEPPELSFTVTVPEKKKPPVVIPAKPKVPKPVPRKNSPPVKYRLKFRFG